MSKSNLKKLTVIMYVKILSGVSNFLEGERGQTHPCRTGDSGRSGAAVVAAVCSRRDNRHR